MKNFKHDLKQFGFSDNEVDVYLSLLRKNPATVLELSKSTKLNRTTTHITVESLIRKGMATQLKYGTRRQILAEPPEKLDLILNQEKLALSKKEDTLKELIASLASQIKIVQDSMKTEVRYYEGIKEVRNLYDSILKSSEIKSYVDPIEVQNFFPENREKFIKAVELNECEIWDLQDYNHRDDEFTKLAKKSKKYHLKYFPLDVTIYGMDYLIYEDSIAIIQGGDDVTGIVIKSKPLFENSKTLYDLMWRLLP